ncbi:amidase [Nocardioides marmoribigeumensis]|uniref:Amidase n=1 Tax=Nocardioides marmoribigeumensis TaxID=433649 RepID=A0ABU2C070_9ACTN|nr:amidase [Nocardioides marmoribigeumensis]MDR7364046.1 amidase [Nocardioides marmoribigeumensis]
MTDELLWSGVSGQATAVAAGEVSAAALLEATLARIEQVDPTLHAFTVVAADAARAEAAARDAAQAAGEPLGPLHGVPVAIKDENDVAGLVTSFGGHGNSEPVAEDGEATRLLREAGAVVVGKTNLPEFGQFPFTESERFGNTLNPWDTSRTPGGSSGGTAAAVASGMVAAAIGGDGGGSIRIPSACCGLFGLKPTRGRVSASPWPDLWGSLGVIGPLTRSVLDSALVYDVLRDRVTPTDRWRAPDSTSFVDAARSGGDGSAPRLRIGWTPRSTVPGVKPSAEQAQALRETVTLLGDLGHEVVEVAPRYPDVTAAFLPQLFGAVREETRRVQHPDRLEKRTREMARLGVWATPRVVAAAERRGERIAEIVDARVFGLVDVLLTPTIPGLPPPVGAVEGRSAVPSLLASTPMVGYCAIWNVTGHPAAAVPAGLSPDDLPTSVQLVARRGAETTLLALAAEIEKARPWAGRRPVVS